MAMRRRRRIQDPKQVPPKGNILLLEKRLAAGGNARGTIVVVPRGSHGFVRKDGRCPQKFKDVPRQAPELFEALAAWDPFAGQRE